MILYYALGGGLGHITRALAALHTLRVREKTLILCSADTSQIDLSAYNVEIIRPHAFSYQEKDKLSAYIQLLIDKHRPSELIVDSFPLGIYGELDNIVFRNIRTYLARILKWERYTKIAGNRFFIFNQTFLLEPLHDDHYFIVGRISETTSTLALEDPPCNKPLPSITELDKHWLILHSGPDEEVDDLIDYAKEIRKIEQKQNPLLLVNPSAVNKWSHQKVTKIRYYPAHMLMPHVEKIVTACGFNVMRQARAYRHKHHFFPFARRFDDQHFRAKLYREGSQSKSTEVKGLPE